MKAQHGQSSASRKIITDSTAFPSCKSVTPGWLVVTGQEFAAHLAGGSVIPVRRLWHPTAIKGGSPAKNRADTVGACVLMKLAQPNLTRLEAVCADAGYRGTFEIFMEEEFGLPVHISEKIKDGFAVIPRRWVVERSFAWFNGQRRLSKDYERQCPTSESMIYIASISRLLRACVN